MYRALHCRRGSRLGTRFALLLGVLFAGAAAGRTVEIGPAVAEGREEFETVANSLEPGDELVLHGGTYSQTGRRAVTAQGTAAEPIVIRAADRESPLLTRPADQIDRHNNIEFVDCRHLVVRGLRFKGGSSGVRFIRGHHVTFEDCEISHTGNNALTMNSGDCNAFIVRRNHIHHTGLSDAHPTEGEGMYIGCHDGGCITTGSLFEGNYIHHLRSTSVGGNDGIEIKFGSYGNTVRDNVIHDTNIGRKYPGIFVYGGGKDLNIVEGNAIWNAGEGIQVVSDAIVRNNVILDCLATGITAAPHAAVPRMRNVTIINNTIVGHPTGVRIRWAKAENMTFCNNAVYCPGGAAVDAAGIERHVFRANYVSPDVRGATIDDRRFHDGGALEATFADPRKRDYRPCPGSPLRGAADAAFVSQRDFNGAARISPFDVGACEVEALPAGVGGQIIPGFKDSEGRDGNDG